MRVRRFLLVAVVFAAGCGNPRYAFDEDAVRERIEARAGLTGDALDDMVDEVRGICKIEGMDDFSRAAELRMETTEGVDAYHDVVHGCPQRFD